MPTCAAVLAATLRDAGITRLFGLPGGEILDFLEAARAAGLDFLLTRHEATASFMADVSGQIAGVPGVCVATLGPGAVNMTLGVANAFLDRSPVIAITAAHATTAAGYATHQNLDLNAVYRPFTKLALTLDGLDTASKVRAAIDVSLAPRRGPVHIALPSDVARREDRVTGSAPTIVHGHARRMTDSAPALEAVAQAIRAARRPVAILGLDLDPRTHPQAVRTFVERLGAPVLVTPKAKGMLPEDHPLFCGVCAGVSADSVVLEFFKRADVLVGLGFEPVESDKLWHQTMKLVSIGPSTIAADSFHPHAEVVGDLEQLLSALSPHLPGVLEWDTTDCSRLRDDIAGALHPPQRPRGLSGFELTRRLRDLFPRETLFTTDVGSVKMITSQAWTTYAPLTFFESNGLSAMSYSLPAAMALRLQYPDVPILCTIGDGGFGMTIADIETCVREGLRFVVVVYNDSSLSLIDAAQQRRGYPTQGVRYGAVDFAAASAAFGAWACRVETMAELDAAVGEAQRVDRIAVIDAIVDPTEYLKQTS
jgi:acetolactate synthase I/II/III large subunit